jgi:bifunctional DNase/RNase
MYIEMKVHSVAVDPFSNVPIIMLKDLGEHKTLPIWIGTLEANSITAHIESKITSRPMTHDIMAQILEKSNVKVLKIEISDLKSNVYYASIHIASGENVFKVDSRPSDAIALAIRTGAPIMVEEKVIEKSMEIKIESVTDESDLNPDELLEMLDELSIEDLGKYKM